MEERTLFGRGPRYPGGLHDVAAGVLAWLQPNGELGESNAVVIVGEGEALLVRARRARLSSRRKSMYR